MFIVLLGLVGLASFLLGFYIGVKDSAQTEAELAKVKAELAKAVAAIKAKLP